MFVNSLQTKPSTGVKIKMFSVMSFIFTLCKGEVLFISQCREIPYFVMQSRKIPYFAIYSTEVACV